MTLPPPSERKSSLLFPSLAFLRRSSPRPSTTHLPPSSFVNLARTWCTVSSSSSPWPPASARFLPCGSGVASAEPSTLSAGVLSVEAAALPKAANPPGAGELVPAGLLPKLKPELAGAAGIELAPPKLNDGVVVEVEEDPNEKPVLPLPLAAVGPPKLKDGAAGLSSFFSAVLVDPKLNPGELLVLSTLALGVEKLKPVEGFSPLADAPPAPRLNPAVPLEGVPKPKPVPVLFTDPGVVPAPPKESCGADPPGPNLPSLAGGVEEDALSMLVEGENDLESGVAGWSGPDGANAKRLDPAFLSGG